MEIREIIFRGKRFDNGKWIYGDLFNGKDSLYIQYWENGEYRSYEVDPTTIGQYTGMTDKNGAKIFEGDTVRAITPQKGGAKGPNIGIVEFHKSAFSVEWSNFLTYGRSFIGYLDNIEVIGNIHDNQKILGVSDGTTD